MPKQKNYLMEVYDVDGTKTIIVRQQMADTKGFETVLVTNKPDELVKFISNK